MATELELAAVICALVFGGESEVRHDYIAAGRSHHVRVDCETDSHVIEVGLDDRRSSFDSLHQAIFAAELTGKIPVVIIVDTNSVEESVEYQIETTARWGGVNFLTVQKDFVIRLQMTSYLRNGPVPNLFGM